MFLAEFFDRQAGLGPFMRPGITEMASWRLSGALTVPVDTEANP